MSIVERYTPGTFSYAELVTTDAAGARAFYTSLFGWEVDDVPMEPGGVYHMFRKGAHVVGAMHQMGPAQQAQGIPTHWGSYVTVESADQAAARAGELGGAVLMGPFDVMDAGRMAVVQDPTGATLCLWEPRGHVGSQVRDEPSAFCWNELGTSDVDRAREFYTGLFGWTPEAQELGGIAYTTFFNEGVPVAGLYALSGDMEAMPAGWMVHFQVEDCDRAAGLARELGAEVPVEPMDVPGIGRWSMLRDPQGAYFSIVTGSADACEFPETAAQAGSVPA